MMLRSSNLVNIELPLGHDFIVS